VEDEDGELVGMTCRIYRSDRARPVSVTEYLAECARKTEPWATSPRRMLRHKALIQCARYAFGICGIADPDEAETIAAPRRASVTIDPYDPAQLPEGAVSEVKGEELF
jgi:hypothetical protein